LGLRLSGVVGGPGGQSGTNRGLVDRAFMNTRQLDSASHESAVVRAAGDTSRSLPSLPAGFVGWKEAARISGIGITAWKRWQAEGKITCGQWLTRPGGGRCRIYPVEALERMMRESDLRFPPEGTVDRHEAARMFGVAGRTFSTWELEGRIGCGRLVSVPGKAGQYKVYPVDELRRLVEEFKTVAPFPPPGFVGRREACRMFGIALGTWTTWESMGRITCGRSVPIPNKAGRAKIYPVAELEALKLEFTRQRDEAASRAEPYLDPVRAGVVRVPVSTEKHKGMEALIDAADLPLVRGKRWHWSSSKSNGGSVVLSVSGTPKPSLARIILGVDDPEQLVSHVNGDRLDCRRANLVVRSRSQVRLAARKRSHRGGRACSSRFKGVTRTACGRKWAASINAGDRYQNLGRFRSEVDAALAYDAALREVMGADVAGLNLPDAAEVERLRALEPAVEDDATWPPPGMVDRHEACRMFGVSLRTWTVWERRGRITCGRYHRLPDDKPGRCKLYPKVELERARVEIERFGKPYPDPARPGVWRVPLKSYLAHREALIDEQDLPIVEGKNWNWSERSDEGRTEGVVVLATTGRQAPLHRMIAGATDPTTRVSFVNGDALDCRRANLAARTQAETNQTSRKMLTHAGKECTSRFKGVSFQQDRGKWVAQIRKDDTHKNIGRFADELAAAEAYDDCARVWFGPHAYVNFPDRESSEANRLWARRVLDGSLERERRRRRRLKRLERKLSRAAREANADKAKPSGPPPAPSTDGAAATISRKRARKLFGVPLSIWRRWRRHGWLPEYVAVDGRKAYRLSDIAFLLGRCGIGVLPYPDSQRPGVYRLPLSGATAKGREALIDADAVPLVQTRRWRFSAADSGRGGEVQTMNPGENVRLHYVVMGIAGENEYHVGHRNDDPLDCRRANLVVRTQTETHANHRKQSTFCGRPCTSRYKGVWRDKRRERWVATIKKDGVQRRLGGFRDEIAAAQAYDEAARELFGEHARLNFPDGVDAALARAAAA